MAIKKQSKKQPEKVNYWNSDLTGLMRVYAQEVNYKKNGKPASFLKFSTSLGVKDEDGNWSNLYFNVRFMKGDAPEVDGGMNFEIEIGKAFLTFEIFQTKSGEEIKAILDERQKKLNVSFVIDTLEYLRKGGRCSAVAALGANLLKLKPCIEVHEGKMSVAKKYRGTLAKAIENYVTDRIKGRDDIDMKRIFITDSGVDAEIVENVEQLLRRYAGFEEIHHTLAGSTISGHCGPGCLGILYYNK